MGKFEKQLKQAGLILEAPEAVTPTPILATKHITIPVVEYIYLQRIDALMDTLLQADNYNNTQVVAAIRETVKGMRSPGGVGAGL